MKTLFGHNGAVIRNNQVLRFLDTVDTVDPQELETIRKIIILGFDAGIDYAHEQRLEKRAMNSHYG